jgi:hypothetical protein
MPGIMPYSKNGTPRAAYLRMPSSLISTPMPGFSESLTKPSEDLPLHDHEVGHRRAHVTRRHCAQERCHHVRRKRCVIEVREIRDALSLAQPTTLLQVGHDDVDGAGFEHLAEAEGEILVLARADGSRRRLGDALVRLHVLRRHRLFKPHQIQRLQHLGDFLARGGVVTAVHVGADVEIRPRRFARGRHLVVHPAQLRRARGPVVGVVLVRIVLLVEIELDRVEAHGEHLARGGGELFRLRALPLVKRRVHVDADAIAEFAAE